MCVPLKSSAYKGGVEPRLALFEDPCDWPFFLPRLAFSRLPPLIEMLEAALGFELVDTTDSVGELAPDN